MIQSRRIETPFGTLVVSSDDKGICGIVPIDYFKSEITGGNSELLDMVEIWLDNYFSGDIKNLKPELPKLSLKGTIFQKMVWKALLDIPYGETRTYGFLAETIGKSKMACRAIGQAVKHNPIMIMIPCHRIIGADGSLIGFAYGMELKQQLLNREGFLF